MRGYYAAQICENGHLVTEWGPDPSMKFCQACGARVINQCSSCGEDIPGQPEGSFSAGQPDVASGRTCCRNCGKPYPWTERRLGSLEKLLVMGASDTQKAELAEDLPALVTSSPSTEAAATRFKLFLKAAKPEVVAVARAVITEAACAAAEPIISPG